MNAKIVYKVIESVYLNCQLQVNLFICYVQCFSDMPSGFDSCYPFSYFRFGNWMTSGAVQKENLLFDGNHLSSGALSNRSTSLQLKYP